MRIALYHNLPSGGAKRAVFETTRRLAKRHQVDVFTLSTAEHDFGDLRPWVSSYRIFPFESSSLFSRPFGLLNHGVRAVDLVRLRACYQRIAAEINDSVADVALIHPDRFTSSPGLLQFLKLPSVYYCQDPLRLIYDPPLARPYSELTGVRRLVNRLNVLRWAYLRVLASGDRTSLWSANKVLVNSYFSRESIYRIYNRSATVCYLGIDSDAFPPAQHDRDDYIISVGAITPVKGFDFLIKSLSCVPTSLRPKLVIVANFAVESEQRYLENLARDCGVAIEFRVMVSNTELIDLYHHAQMTVYAPVLEPFGFVPLESMACGTPVVAVAEGGIRETVRHGETGLLVDRDPAALAATIIRLLTDAELAAELGKKGPSYVRQNWPWAGTVEQLEKHLIEVAQDQHQ